MAGDYDEKPERARKCLHKLCFAGLKAKDRSLRQLLRDTKFQCRSCRCDLLLLLVAFSLKLAAASPRQLQVIPDRQARLGLVHGIKMQSRCAALQQAFAHLADDLLAKALDASCVVAV